MSAFATDLGLALAQRRVADKGGETAAVPELLAALELRGALVSLDAAGCQRPIARQIRERGADYLLAAKGNQPGLHQALEDAFADQPGASAHHQQLTGHGRHSVQLAQVLPNTGQIDRAQWPDCASLARVLSLRVEAGRAKPVETRYYISSAALDPEELARAVRGHAKTRPPVLWRHPFRHAL